jgi:regulatory protein
LPTAGSQRHQARESEDAGGFDDGGGPDPTVELDDAGGLDHTGEPGGGSGCDDACGLDHTGEPGDVRKLEAALASCYRHLARREHSVAELRARLERERLPTAAITEALATVADQGYLDDARYARLLIENRRAVDGWGLARIRARLEAAGIGRELIDELTAGFDEASELEVAVTLIRRRCVLPLTDDGQRRRALGMLVQRGFDADVAHDAITACGSSFVEDET